MQESVTISTCGKYLLQYWCTQHDPDSIAATCFRMWQEDQAARVRAATRLAMASNNSRHRVHLCWFLGRAHRLGSEEAAGDGDDVHGSAEAAGDGVDVHGSKEQLPQPSTQNAQQAKKSQQSTPSKKKGKIMKAKMENQCQRMADKAMKEFAKQEQRQQREWKRQEKKDIMAMLREDRKAAMQMASQKTPKKARGVDHQQEGGCVKPGGLCLSVLSFKSVGHCVSALLVSIIWTV